MILFTLHLVYAAKTRGVNPNQQEYYYDAYQSGVFRCIDANRKNPGSLQMPYSNVNDGYCDCGDGSDEPGTNACNDGSFYCSNGGRTVSSIRVDDGVCDCCDGSDESGSICEDICEDEAARITAHTNKMVQLRLEGEQLRKKLVESVANGGREKLQAAVPKLRESVKDRLRAFRNLRALAQSGGRAAHGLMAQTESAYHSLVFARMDEYYARTLTKTHFGEDDAFMPLAGQCFESPPTNEKQLKGGSSNSIPRTYVFIICPFRNITQTEPWHDDWLVEQAIAKAGDRQLSAETISRIRAEAEPQRPTMLGFWKAWGSNRTSMMYFNKGEMCANGVSRTVNVTVECGLSTYLHDVEEDGVCMYQMKLSTPAACVSQVHPTTRTCSAADSDSAASHTKKL